MIQRSGEGFTSFNGNKRANFGGEKKYNEAFWGVYFKEQARKLKIQYRLRPRILSSLLTFVSPGNYPFLAFQSHPMVQLRDSFNDMKIAAKRAFRDVLVG